MEYYLVMFTIIGVVGYFYTDWDNKQYELKKKKEREERIAKASKKP